MNREDIIRMAREAASVYATETWTFALAANQLERFAALVAAAEREACAKVCDALAEGWKKYPGKDDSGFIALSNAGVTIRARGQA